MDQILAIPHDRKAPNVLRLCILMALTVIVVMSGMSNKQQRETLEQRQVPAQQVAIV